MVQIYDIDFNGNLKTRILIKNDGQIDVLECMNGYGDRIDISDIIIEPV